MKEKTNLKQVEAAMDAFGSERLRWLLGKGDVLLNKGELADEKYDELVQKTVRDEVERSYIAKILEAAPATVSSLAKATKMETDRIVWNLLAMLKWGRAEIVGKEGHEYLYGIKEV